MFMILLVVLHYCCITYLCWFWFASIRTWFWLTLPSDWAHLFALRCLAFSYLYYLGQSSSLNSLANRASKRYPLPFPSISFWCWRSDFPLGMPIPQLRSCGSFRTGSGHITHTWLVSTSCPFCHSDCSETDIWPSLIHWESIPGLFSWSYWERGTFFLLRWLSK